MKILLAVDGSSFSHAATAEVARRTWPVDSEIKVLSIFEPPAVPTPEAWTIPPDYFEEMTNASSTKASNIVAAAIATLKQTLPASTRITGEFVQGFPRSMILDEAERWGADLIVVGSHGYRAWERFLLGSVSQAVVAHAKCSVEVVRNRNGAQR